MIAVVALPAVQTIAAAIAVAGRVIRWWCDGQRYIEYLLPEPNPRQTPGAVAQATAATGTGVWAAAGPAAATPAAITNAAFAAPAVLCATAVVGAAIGHELLLPTKMTPEECHKDLIECLLSSSQGWYDP